MPEETEERKRFITNYFAIRSKRRTMLTLFERRKDQITLVFKTWRNVKSFELVESEVASETLEFILKGDLFTEFNNRFSTVLTATDQKIKQLANFDSSRDFEFYSINAEKKVILVQTEANAGFYPPLITFNPNEFDQIMQDSLYAPTVSQTVQASWAFGGSMSEELASLISEED